MTSKSVYLKNEHTYNFLVMIFNNLNRAYSFYSILLIHFRKTEAEWRYSESTRLKSTNRSAASSWICWTAPTASLSTWLPVSSPRWLAGELNSWSRRICSSTSLGSRTNSPSMWDNRIHFGTCLNKNERNTFPKGSVLGVSFLLWL